MIIGEIRRHLRDNNPIRVSRSMRDLAYKALQIKDRIFKETQKDATIEEIAKELNVEKEEIIISLDAIQEPISLQEPVYNESSENIYVMDQVKDTKNTDELWAENITIAENNPNIKKYIKEKLAEGVYLLNIPQNSEIKTFIKEIQFSLYNKYKHLRGESIKHRLNEIEKAKT